MKVELLPCNDHRGREFDQWWLHVDGRRMGVVPKRLNGHVSLTVKVDDKTKAEIKAEVEKLIGTRSAVSMPSEVPDDDEEQDDDEYA